MAVSNYALVTVFFCDWK